MLEQSLLELAVATCFSSSALASKLKSTLCPSGPSTGLPNMKRFQDDCHKLLEGALEADHPRRFRRNDIASALQLTWPHHMILGSEGHIMPFLDQLFARLFVENGDVIHYRDDKVQDYVRLSARIDPALLVAWRLAQRIGETPTLAAHDLVRLVSAQQPFFGPATVAGRAKAENHAHIGGAYQAGMALMAGLLPGAPAPASEGTYESEIDFSSLIYLARALLREGDLTERAHADGGDTKALDRRIRNAIRCSLGMQSSTDAPSNLSWEWLTGQVQTVRADNPRWLRQQIARSMVELDIGQAWLWFLIWLWTHYLDPHCHPRLRMAIFFLFNGLMCARRDLVMDGQGLSRFIEYYHRKRRKTQAGFAHVSAAKTLFQGIDDVAELKVGSNVLTPTAIGDWLGHLARATGVIAPTGLRQLSARDAQRYRDMMDRWHFCVHFSRSKSMLHNPAMVWESAASIQEFKHSKGEWDRPSMLGGMSDGEEMLQLVPSRWLRGLDVAGDENQTKTEIYAPALRWLRDGLKSKDEGEPATDGLHLSVHAGEDYAHPVSGMRHVDETVQFCEMRSGDRLGHALALGISVRAWASAHGDMILPVDEHLDNLVWVWHYASVMSARLPLASQVLPLFERRIHIMLQFVPWAHGACMELPGSAAAPCQSAARVNSITPALLFRAWQLRRNCSFQLIEYENRGKILDRKIVIAVPDIALFSAHPAATAADGLEVANAVGLYRQRWKWLAKQVGGKVPPESGCSATSPPLRRVRIRCELNDHERWDAKADLESRSGLIEDTISAQELDFIEALQDWLLDVYDEKGLVIEANPTSNVYVARMNRHAEHPIFRWYPPDESWLEPGNRFNRFGLRRGPIRVCVNTDDAGITPTTLRTEFALLRAAALEHGVTRTNAEAWLSRLREFGHEEFRRKHRAVWVRRLAGR
ncbi:hypothetical protein F2P45_33455 [Massilia sp. CCM 8733]|uniref:Adenosine deaminase domain-containing protein n=1 Tax=Massilia mucilaginosa TaxID=2609282 RepID=A0ABX0P452_9BURK|nr:antiviral RADAR system adenosine deaminase RdrB [Massilia mucilaginosa]NHZ93869.1 hypothetical protein [Massilia mucilaginosa]